MKTYNIYIQNYNEKTVDKNSGPICIIKAKNNIEALKKFYLSLNSRSLNLSSYFNNLTYCAINNLDENQ